MYKVIFTKEAERDFLGLDKSVQERVASLLERNCANPYRKSRKLFGTGEYRFRVGDYRIIFRVDETAGAIVVHKIGNRKNVYG